MTDASGEAETPRVDPQEFATTSGFVRFLVDSSTTVGFHVTRWCPIVS